jgi:TatD DNase family protein
VTPLLDAHAHVDRFGDAWPAALEQIRGRRIVTLAVSMDPASWEATRRLAALEPLLVPAFGIHPWEAPAWHRRLHEVEALLDDAPVLGEVGLDRRFVKDPEAWGPQEEVFAFFLDGARRTGKLLNLHTSGAEARVAALLARHGVEKAVVHWYNGPMRPLAAMAESGVYFTAGVELLVSERMAKIARRIPLERLLVETDNPGGWAWLTGEPGMPALLERVVARLAEVRRLAPEEMEEVLDANAGRLMAAAGLAWPRSAPWTTTQ